MGDKWLLCNGDTVSAADYPVLAEMLPNKVTEKKLSASSNLGPAQCVAGHDGTWVTITRDSSAVFMTTDHGETWTQKTNPRGIGGTCMYALGYYNGMWVCAGFTSSYGCIGYTTDPTGTWTLKQITTVSSVSLYGIDCYEGTWVAVGYYDSNQYPYFYVSTDPAGTWTEVKGSSKATTLWDVECYNGTWVAVGVEASMPVIYTTTNPTGTWTRIQPDTEKTTLFGIACHNGTWVAAGTRGTGSRACIYVSDNPTGAWRAKDISTSSSFSASGIVYANGRWIITNGYAQSSHIITNDSGTGYPLGEWTELSLGMSASSSSFEAISADGSKWVAVGHENDYPYVVQALGGPSLPSISVDGVHTYIKAKE